MAVWIRLASAVALAVVAALGAAGCDKIAGEKAGKTTPHRDAPHSSSFGTGSTSTELIPNEEIAAATFVQLDYAKFPNLPPWKVPQRGFISVARSGGDYTSIAAALRAAKPGGVVVVSGGEYAEQDPDAGHLGLVIRKPVTLMARPGQKVVVRPRGEAHSGLIVKASDVVVRGIHLRGFRNLGVVWDGAVQRTVLADLHVEGSEEGIATMDSRLDGLLAFNVRVSKASNIGFHCGQGPCRNWRLENVTVDLSGGGSGSGADAFAIESGDNFLLVNVTTTGAAADGIDVKGKRVVVYNCHVHHVGRNGIKLWQGGDVINTVVHHTGADAALVTEEGRIRILHSVFGFHNYRGDTSYFGTLGYDTRGVSKAEIINSIFFNASGGLWIDPKAEVVVRGSIFWNNENGNVLEHGNHRITIAGGSPQFGKLGYGAGRIVDPKLDASMKPQAGSAARNGGVRLGQQYPAHDRRGQPRLRGPAPDVGAYEVE